MVEPGLDKLFTELEATFESAVAREEEAAAADLGFALAQTNSLRDVLARLQSAVVLVDEDLSSRVEHVGTDYVVTESPTRFIPIQRAILRASGSGLPPRASATTLLLVLRRLARRRELVEVSCARGDRHQGRLLGAGEDYLTLSSSTGHVFIGSKAVSAIHLLHEPSAFDLV